MRHISKSRNVLSKQKSILACVFCSLFIAFLSTLPWGEKIDGFFARPLEFEVRRWLKKDPQIDPRLQIYVVEDATVQYLKKENLSLSDWSLLLEGFKPLNPRIVLIDKIFGIPNPNDEAAAFVSKVKSLSFPVVAGAFIVPTAIKNRPLLPVSDLNEKLVEGSSKVVKAADDLDWLKIEPGYPYGPAENILESFRYVGHIMFSGNSYFKPLQRISNYQGLPGAPFFMAKDLHIESGALVADGVKVPIDSKGRTFVNFVSPNLFYDRTDKLSLLIELARTKKPFPPIKEDSVILLLPNQFTGNTDYKETPFGTYPGGYVIASLVNSVLSGKWIYPMPMGSVAVFVSGCIGAAIITYLAGYAFWFVVLGLVTLIGLLGLYTFSYSSMVFPWFFSSLSLFLSSTVIYAMNARELLKRRIEGIAGTASPLEVKYDEKTGQPKKLGRYHVIEKIGKGGMGEVYRAKIYGAGGFEKEFALKRVAPEYWTDKTVIQAFLDEARLSSYLNHINIVQVFELLRLEDSYMLVMEYVKGQGLNELLTTLGRANSRMPIEIAAYIIEQVCEALDYAHSTTDPSTGKALKLVHRDISPHNILISDDGTVKVIDFGIAKGTFTTEHTKTGLIKGKLAYMSPEQAAGKPLDRRSDIFSTALVFYELLAGKRVWEDGNKSEIETLRKIKDWKVKELPLKELKLPAPIEAVLEKGLEREQDQRYEKAEEMYKDLDNYLSQSGFGIGQKALAEFLKNVAELKKAQNPNVKPLHTSEKTVVSEIDIQDRKTGTFQ